jgi:hypothetical protein
MQEAIIHGNDVPEGVLVNFQQLPSDGSTLRAFFLDYDCYRSAGFDDKYDQLLTTIERQEYANKLKSSSDRQILRTHDEFSALLLPDAATGAARSLSNVPWTLVYRYEPDCFAINRIIIKTPYVA